MIQPAFGSSNKQVHQNFSGIITPSLLFFLALAILLANAVEQSTHHILDLSRPLTSHTKNLDYTSMISTEEGLNCAIQSPQLCWLHRHKYQPQNLNGQLSSITTLSLPSLNLLSERALPCPGTTSKQELPLSSFSHPRTCTTSILPLNSITSLKTNLHADRLIVESQNQPAPILLVTGDARIRTLTSQVPLSIIAFGKVEIDGTHCPSLHIVSVGSSVTVKNSNGCRIIVLAKDFANSSPKLYTPRQDIDTTMTMQQPLWVD
jgi:hypothetical protein